MVMKYSYGTVPEEGLAFFPQLGEESVRQPLEPSHVLRRDAVPELSNTIARIETTFQGIRIEPTLVFNKKKVYRHRILQTQILMFLLAALLSSLVIPKFVFCYGSPSAPLIEDPGLPYKNQTQPPG
jgi:hypothetical protein